MTNILVLGGSSFSGSYISALLTTNNYVVSMNRNSKLENVYRAPRLCPENHIEYEWNLNAQDGLLETVLQRHKIEVVVNFAAQSMVGQSWERPEDWYEANLVGFSRTIKTLSAHKRLTRFIHFTTPEVYGSTQGWVKENFNFAPNTPYAVSRAASDWHLRALYENFDFPVIFTRAANVYGEHQHLYRIIPKVILSTLTGNKIPLQGGGKSIRSFIHISDVHDAVREIIANGKIGETYHISTKDLISIQDLVRKITSRMNTDFDSLVELVPDRPGKDFAYQLDSTKIRTELNWAEKVTLEDGIDRTIEWVRNNFDTLQKLPIEYVHRR